jgi:hypothetical protein
MPQQPVPEGWAQHMKWDPRAHPNPRALFQGKHDETAPLEEQVKYMAERHKVLSDFISYLIDEKDYMEYALEWTGVFPGDWAF